MRVYQRKLRFAQEVRVWCGRAALALALDTVPQGSQSPPLRQAPSRVPVRGSEYFRCPALAQTWEYVRMVASTHSYQLGSGNVVV
jgi:hypothetical protein